MTINIDNLDQHSHGKLESFFLSDKLFFAFIGLILLVVIFTFPFLRYPYDWVYHIVKIGQNQEIINIPNDRSLWHFLWAKIFVGLGIPPSELFLRARIIHIIQTYIGLFCIYFYSNVVLRNVFKRLDKSVLRCLSIWAVVVWFSIFATFSMHYHQVWNMWYSINYQVTLPLAWYIIALSIVLFFERTSIVKKVISVFQILLFSRFILQAHSMEFVYYLMHMSIVALLYMDKVLSMRKRYLAFLLSIITTIIFFAIKYQPENYPLLSYLHYDKFSDLYKKILHDGTVLVNGLNRASSSMNELIYLALFVGAIVLVLEIRNRRRVIFENVIEFRMLLYLVLTSFFVLIPINTISAGIFAVLTRDNVVNRLYFSSSLFVLLPAGAYYLLNLKKNWKPSIVRVNVSLVAILGGVLLFSVLLTRKQLYYKNVKSISESFFVSKVGFHLLDEQIASIGEEVAKLKKANSKSKPVLIFARSDIAFIIKYVYGENVYWHDSRWVNIEYVKEYSSYQARGNKEYSPVLFEIPRDFPVYTPFR